MTISVVLTTYNGEQYILEQLNSLLHQTRQPDEVLIRDDGSTDNTVRICQKFIDQNSLGTTWSVSVNERNLGWAENFLNGFDLAKGELIFPCDQDDIWLDDKISLMADVMEKDDGIGLLTCGYIRQIEDENSCKRENKTFSKTITKLPFDSKMLFVDYPGCVYCFTKWFYEQIKEYRFEGYPHDALLFRMGRLTEKAYYYDFPGIVWRRHLHNATGKPVRENKKMQSDIVYYVNCLELMKKWCDEHPGNEDKAELIMNNISFYQTRLMAFEHKKIIGRNSLFSCLKYLAFYPRPKSILGDVIRIIH